MSTASTAVPLLPGRRVVLNVLARVLRPLLRFALRHGVTAQDVEETVRWVAVDLAMTEREFEIERQRQTKSRVSVLTGLSRKEVQRLVERPAPHEDDEFAHSHRAAEVIAGWTQDPEFSHTPDKPRELSIKGRQSSFQSLVKRYGADVPYRAVLDELVRCNLVEVKDNTWIRLLGTSYQPSSGSEEELMVVRICAGDLLSTIERNFRPGIEERIYQRQVYAYIPYSILPEARRYIRNKAESVERDVDQYLYSLEEEYRNTIEPRCRTGLGLYGYED